MDTPKEEVLWEGHPSQVTGLGAYAVCAVIAAAGIVAGAFTGVFWIAAVAVAIAAVLAIVKFMTIRAVTYRISSERLVTTTGLLTRRTDDVEHYRILDTELVEPLWMRVVGKGNVIVSTRDDSSPVVTLRAIPKAGDVRQTLRNAVEAIRLRKGVRTIDVDTTPDHGAPPS